MNTPGTVRTFVAINLPPRVKIALARLAADLASQTPPGAVRWVKPEAMHLTLRFLGETAVAQLPVITAKLNQLATQYCQFTLGTGILGAFPNTKRPRVIWVSIQAEGETLGFLKRALDEQLAPLGWPLETKPFHPHLTLGRVKDDRARFQLPWNERFLQETWTVTAVHLFESKLLPGGPHYSVRGTAELPVC